MYRRRLFRLSLVCAGVLVVALATLVGFITSRTQANGAYVPRPLTTASPADIAQVALQTVNEEFSVRSGTPQIALSRSVTNDDLVAFGLRRVDFSSIEQPPLALVIIKGDFVNSNLPGTGVLSDYRYVGYVFDLWAGVPALTLASPDGGEFRLALNDPSLPKVPPQISPATPLGLKTRHYGAAAPTVILPSPPATFQPPPVAVTKVSPKP